MEKKEVLNFSKQFNLKVSNWKVLFCEEDEKKLCRKIPRFNKKYLKVKNLKNEKRNITYTILINEKEKQGIQ